MPGATSRLALVLPVGADAASELRVSITDNADTLDNAAIYLQGTLSARNALTGVVAGTFYYVTDSTPPVLTEYNGSAWGTVMLAGAWAVISGAAGVASAGRTASARIIGDCGQTKGALANTSGSTITGGTTLATLPAGTFPTVGVGLLFAANLGGGGTVELGIDTTGKISLLENFPAGHELGIDFGPYALS